MSAPEPRTSHGPVIQSPWQVWAGLSDGRARSHHRLWGGHHHLLPLGWGIRLFRQHHLPEGSHSGPPALGLRVRGSPLPPGPGRGRDESVAEEGPHGRAEGQADEASLAARLHASTCPHPPRVLSPSPGQLLPLERLKGFPQG